MKELMKTFLTICFYEHPAALLHIDMWEKLMLSQKRIIYKISDTNGHINFLIKRGDDFEHLICSPTTDCLFFKNQTFTINDICVSRLRVTYLKALIFGKTSYEDLRNILKIVKDYELC